VPGPSLDDPGPSLEDPAVSGTSHVPSGWSTDLDNADSNQSALNAPSYRPGQYTPNETL